MTEDERKIRRVIERWMDASQAGDLGTVLSLMSDDVVFMTPGSEPFGKKEFAERSKGMEGVRMNVAHSVLEVQVFQDWAFTRTHLDLTVTPPGGDPTHRAGYVLSIFKKKPDGDWVVARDANLLSVQ